MGDVLCNGAEEEEGLLQHQADVAPVFGHLKAPDVSAVYLDGFLAQVIEALRKYMLLNGLNVVDLTMKSADQIRSFEQWYLAEMP